MKPARDELRARARFVQVVARVVRRVAVVAVDRPAAQRGAAQPRIVPGDGVEGAGGAAVGVRKVGVRLAAGPGEPGSSYCGQLHDSGHNSNLLI